MSAEGIVAVVFGFTQIAQGLIILRIQHQFQQQLQSRERKDKYQLSALEKRMEAHQLAYALWDKMRSTLFSGLDAKIPIEREYREFWNSHCLYLSREARESLSMTVVYYGDYQMYLDSWKSKAHDTAERDLKIAFAHFMNTPNVLANGVDLEAMSLEDIRFDGKKINAFGVVEENGNSK